MTGLLPREENETRSLGVIPAIGALGCFGGSLGMIIGVLGNHGIGALGVLAGAGVLIGTLSALIALPMGRKREALRLIPAQPLKSLRLVFYVLPYDEGLDWLAEALSWLAEAPDDDVRRLYLSSYRRGMPKLVWVSWSEALHCHCRNRGPEAPSELLSKGGAQPGDSAGWRLLFDLISGPDDRWRRGFLLSALAGLFLVVALQVASVSRTDGAAIVVLSALTLSLSWRLQC